MELFHLADLFEGFGDLRETLLLCGPGKVGINRGPFHIFPVSSLRQVRLGIRYNARRDSLR